MILLDYRDKRPIFEQVVEKLEKLIVSGALEADTRMPSVRSLGMELSVNPNTIQRAYARLEQDGYLYTISGRGSFVAPRESWEKGKLDKSLEEFEKILRLSREAGIEKSMLLELVERVYREDSEQRGEKGQI